MPLLAYLISNFPNISKELGLGFIILGSCPGGTASNVITYLCRGNVSLSLICTLFSTIVAIFITPYLILFLAEKSIEININKLISSTASIILIPLVFGLLMKYIFASSS